MKIDDERVSSPHTVCLYQNALLRNVKGLKLNPTVAKCRKVAGLLAAVWRPLAAVRTTTAL